MEKPKYYCETCDFSAVKLCHWKDHLSTKKHSQQNFPAEEFYCKYCDVKCGHMSVMERHKKTKKHIEAAKNSGQTETKYLDIITKLLLDNQRTNNDNNELRNLVIEQSKTIDKVLDKNTEVISKAIESIKSNNTNITTNNTQNNNQNNKFNINVYLNETCKDAINFSEFLENIEVSYQDLENNVQLGFVNGIAKIFTDNLKQLELHQRPIHCTDVKREVVYIKENNVWTKQLNNDKLHYAVNVISHKGIKKLMMWKRENPEYQDVNSEFSNKCIDIQRATMAGYNQNIYNPKVIHVIARETAIRK